MPSATKEHPTKSLKGTAPTDTSPSDAALDDDVDPAPAGTPATGPGSDGFVWDEEESEALRVARKDAEMTASADPVRAYLKQIGRVALLNAELEVQLAKRIEAGVYAVERLSEVDRQAEPQLCRDLRWIVRDGQRAKDNLLE